MRSGHGLFDGQEAQAQATTRVRFTHGWHARILSTSWHAHSKVFFLNWDDTQTLLHYKLCLEKIMSPSWLSSGVLLNILDVCTPMC